MKMQILGFVALGLTYPLAAQMAPTPSARPTPATRPGHQSPCWQQAGVSRSALEQRRQIEENTRSQVESVCSDSSLTPQQKHEKIRQLHQEARQQAERLVTPQQEQALRSCREKRGEVAHGGGMHAGSGVGPCGEMASAGRP